MYASTYHIHVYTIIYPVEAQVCVLDRYIILGPHLVGIKRVFLLLRISLDYSRFPLDEACALQNVLVALDEASKLLEITTNRFISVTSRRKLRHMLRPSHTFTLNKFHSHNCNS